MVDVLQKPQPELGDAKKIGFENTNNCFAAIAPPASFCSPAKDWRQHQLLQGALKFLLSLTVC